MWLDEIILGNRETEEDEGQALGQEEQLGEEELAKKSEKITDQ